MSADALHVYLIGGVTRLCFDCEGRLRASSGSHCVSLCASLCALIVCSEADVRSHYSRCFTSCFSCATPGLGAEVISRGSREPPWAVRTGDNRGAPGLVCTVHSLGSGATVSGSPTEGRVLTVRGVCPLLMTKRVTRPMNNSSGGGLTREPR